jgi:hypothetical protein
MAKIDIQDRIAYDRDLVYRTFRDHLDQLQPYLPTVKEILVESYDREGDHVRIVNIWKAQDGEIPTVAQKFIKPEMLQWTDRAHWRDGDFECDWDMEVGFLAEAISCSGTTRYVDEGDKTNVHIQGELHVDARKIPGVPRLVAGKVGSVVETFVVKMITPNLREVNRGMEKFLAQKD